MSSKYASLHSGLLARKGHASPAIPSPLAHVSYTDEPHERRDIEPQANAPLIARKPEHAPTENTPAQHGEARGLRRLPTRPAESPSPRPVRREAPASAPSSSAESHARETSSRDTPPVESGCCGGMAAMASDEAHHEHYDPASVFKAGVRLSAEQKRRLKTVAVQMNWSQQRILSEALDQWLDKMCEREMKNCACLRARLGE